MKRSLATLCTSLVLLTGPVLLAGCSGGDAGTSSTDDTSAAGPVAGAVGAPEGVAGGAPATGPGAGKAGSAGAVPLGRVTPATGSVVRTGELEVVVADVAAAADETARLVRTAGGQVEADDRARDGGPQRAVLRLRVPPAAFDTTVDRLGALGQERSRRLGSEDVTEQVVDLDSRLATQRAGVARVRALLDRAKDLGEVVQVEAELTRRTADLESLEARLAALTAQVDLATLSVRLTGREAMAGGGGPLGFGDGLRGGWDALRRVGRGAGVAAGALLPWSPLLLVAGALAWRSRRRSRPAAA